MRKKIFNRLTVKVFLISFAVQIISGLLICFVLYSQTPEMMYSPKDELDDLMMELREVAKVRSGDIVDDFIRRTGMQLAFFDQEDYVIGKRNKPLDDIGTLTIKTEEEYRRIFESLPEKGEMGTYGVQFAGSDKDYMVQYFDSGKQINLIPRALYKSYPLMISVVVALSLVSSCIYALLFARPVKKLSKVSESMAQMDLKVRCDEKRGDEIGDLARDLNTMAEALDNKINELEDEIRRVRELESQKEMFFDAASHELKTPVTILEGHIRGMIEGVGPYEDHDEYLAKSLRTVKQMESLINEILTASKMQSADDVVMNKIDMSEVIGSKLADSDDLFVIRDITVDKDIDNGLYISANRDLTMLALGAFISNAVFYSKEGSVISVSAHEADGQVRVLIENSDAHIDEKDIDHLFEPFYRPDPSRSSREDGSGLGLYLAKLIVTKQGGDVSLRNTDSGVCAEIVFKLHTKST